MSKDLIRFMHSLFLPAASTLQHEFWQPSADVYQTRDGWQLKLDLAGVKPEDVHVSVSGCRLTVRGTRRDESINEGCHCYRMEIAYSQFERTFEFPYELDPARIATEYRDGMLLVRIRMEVVP
jgi:HSP20 family protein